MAGSGKRIGRDSGTTKVERKPSFSRIVKREKSQERLSNSSVLSLSQKSRSSQDSDKAKDDKIRLKSSSPDGRFGGERERERER
jgi:hypothetical protein